MAICTELGKPTAFVTVFNRYLAYFLANLQRVWQSCCENLLFQRPLKCGPSALMKLHGTHGAIEAKIVYSNQQVWSLCCPRRTRNSCFRLMHCTRAALEWGPCTGEEEDRGRTSSTGMKTVSSKRKLPERRPPLLQLC